jgi:hypothetical protein
LSFVEWKAAPPFVEEAIQKELEFAMLEVPGPIEYFSTLFAISE